MELNIGNTKKYINHEKQTIVSKNVIRKVFASIRDILYKYMPFMNLTEKLALKNKNEKFSVDESAFTKTAKKENVWVLGIINNFTKEFRLECNIKRDEFTLTKFIKTFIEKGNTIISDGWVDYQNLENEGYHHDVHILGGGDFGFGLNSTSTIESLWNALKKN